MGEFVFDFRTIIKQMLWHLKLFLIVMVIGAILLPICAYPKDVQEPITSIEQIELSDTDKLQIQRYKRTSEALDELKQYLNDNRLLFEMGPKDAKAYVFQYVVLSETNQSESIQNVYYNHIQEEVVLVSSQEVFTTTLGDDVLLIKQQDIDRYDIYLKVYSREDTFDSEGFKKQLDALCEEINQLGLKHNLLLIREDVQEGYDYQLAHYQKMVLDEYKYLSEEQWTEKSLLSANANLYLEYEQNGFVQAQNDFFGKKDVVLYSVIGALAGFLFVFVFVIIRYVFSKTPNTIVDVQSIFGIEFLGILLEKEQRKTDKFVDKTLGDKENKYKNTEWKKDNLERVFRRAKKKNAVILNLSNRENIAFEQIILDDYEMMSKMRWEECIRECTNQGLIIILEKDVTLYSMVDEVVSLCDLHEIEILGYFIIC